MADLTCVDAEGAGPGLHPTGGLVRSARHPGATHREARPLNRLARAASEWKEDPALMLSRAGLGLQILRKSLSLFTPISAKNQKRKWGFNRLIFLDCTHFSR